MRTALKCGTVLALAGLILMACKVVSDDNGGASTFEDVKFESGEISQWVWDESKFPKGFKAFSAGTMTGLVNGGAKEYIDKGLSQGFEQDLKNGEQTYLSWVLDFGTEANAQNMYNTKIQQFASEKETATPYSENKAFVRPTLSGYEGYAVFGKFMIWITLDGYGANKSEGKSKTIEFLQTIEQKIKELKL